MVRRQDRQQKIMGESIRMDESPDKDVGVENNPHDTGV